MPEKVPVLTQPEPSLPIDQNGIGMVVMVFWYMYVIPLAVSGGVFFCFCCCGCVCFLLLLLLPLLALAVCQIGDCDVVSGCLLLADRFGFLLVVVVASWF